MLLGKRSRRYRLEEAQDGTSKAAHVPLDASERESLTALVIPRVREQMKPVLLTWSKYREAHAERMVLENLVKKVADLEHASPKDLIGLLSKGIVFNSPWGTTLDLQRLHVAPLLDHPGACALPCFKRLVAVMVLAPWISQPAQVLMSIEERLKKILPKKAKQIETCIHARVVCMRPTAEQANRHGCWKGAHCNGVLSDDPMPAGRVGAEHLRAAHEEARATLAELRNRISALTQPLFRRELERQLFRYQYDPHMWQGSSCVVRQFANAYEEFDTLSRRMSSAMIEDLSAELGTVRHLSTLQRMILPKLRRRVM
uniref:Uncharacterized protein n=1 Tax=Octactis speculum TaxID=3111310 RepID=A0A7S2F9Q9_9STRA